MYATSHDDPTVPVFPARPTDTPISLSMMDNGEILPVLDGQEEITIGRATEGQPIVPDIDLTPYRAYEAGVSRLHASIKFGGSGPVVTDLGSANGTRLNGKKIPPHKAQPLAHGDILTLGKFKVQVLLRAEETRHIEH
jgi:pSer/pThr/pTyr-binding forkhead associated (FHA) protein